MHKTLLLALGILLPGCSARADRVFVAPGRLVSGSSGAQPGYAVKLVRDKRPPAEVVGDDGSVCRLAPDRFAGVERGDWLGCEWANVPDSAGGA